MKDEKQFTYGMLLDVISRIDIRDYLADAPVAKMVASLKCLDKSVEFCIVAKDEKFSKDTILNTASRKIAGTVEIDPVAMTNEIINRCQSSDGYKLSTVEIACYYSFLDNIEFEDIKALANELGNRYINEINAFILKG